jgi:hypothetical protein
MVRSGLSFLLRDERERERERASERAGEGKGRSKRDVTGAEHSLIAPLPAIA